MSPYCGHCGLSTAILPPLLYPWECRSCNQGRYFYLVSLALCDSQSNATQQPGQRLCAVNQVCFFVSQSLFREKIKRSEVAFYGATKTTHCSQTVSYLDKEKKPVDLKKKSILYCIDAWEIWMHNCLCFSFQEVPW